MRPREADCKQGPGIKNWFRARSRGLAAKPARMSAALNAAAALECLALEREAEKDECTALHDSLPLAEQQRRGIALHRLRVSAFESALFGRTLVTLQLTGGRPLPPSKLSSGAMVGLRPASTSATTALVGTVTKASETAICVAFEEMPEDEQLAEPLTLALLYNDVTYRRLEQTLRLLRDDKPPASAAKLCATMLGDGTPPPPVAVTVGAPFNAALNEGQRRAVSFALGAAPVALIHGPPGTGKTTAVVELIRQAVSRGERVLASAASNVAVDNMAERLIGGSGGGSGGKRLRLVRVGHPARLLPSVVDVSLDATMARSDGAAIVRDVSATPRPPRVTAGPRPLVIAPHRFPAPRAAALTGAARPRRGRVQAAGGAVEGGAGRPAFGGVHVAQGAHVASEEERQGSAHGRSSGAVHEHWRAGPRAEHAAARPAV